MAAVAPGFFERKQLVVFGAGYVGAAVARAAAEQGAYVTALTRNASKVAALAAAGCDVVVDELSSESWHAKLRGPVDFVLNCVSSGDGGIEGYRKSYVDGMRSILLWAARRGGVGTLVYTSSTSVYPQTGGVRVDETAPVENLVGMPGVLFEAERLLQAGAGKAIGRWYILRLAGIYGPGRHHLLDQLREGAMEMLGKADQRLNLIHRDDIVTAVLSAFASPAGMKNEIFNLADDTPSLKADLVAWLSWKLGRLAPTFTGEPVPGRRVDVPDRLIANDKIKTMLGWQPRYADFRAGYKALLEA